MEPTIASHFLPLAHRNILLTTSDTQEEEPILAQTIDKKACLHFKTCLFFRTLYTYQLGEYVFGLLILGVADKITPLAPWILAKSFTKE